MKRDHILDFDDLANSPEFEEFYATLWELLHTPLSLVNPEDIKKSKLLCPEDKFNPICKIIRSSPGGREKCLHFDKIKFKEAVELHQGLCYKCYAGLTDFTVPIFVGKKHIATIVCGQILSGAPTEERFNELWDSICDLDIDKQALRKVYFESPHMSPEKIESVLKLLTFFANYFCEVGVRLQILERNNKYPEIEKATEYIKKHYHEPISRSDVADHVAFSEQYFSTLFKKVQGVSFTQYLQEIRIDEVKRLLAGTNTAISKIAINCGFSNLSYFNVFFRRMMKCSPSQYRTENRDF